MNLNMDSDPLSLLLVVLLALIFCSWLSKPFSSSNLYSFSFVFISISPLGKREWGSVFLAKNIPLAYLFYSSVGNSGESNNILSRKYRKLRKFRGNAVLSLKLYLITQVMIVLVGIGYLLLEHPLDVDSKVLSFLVGIVLGTITCMWILSKRKKVGYVVEYLRLVVVVLFLAYLTQYQYYFREVLFISSGTVFLFFFWLITLLRIFKR
ncbi:hypothetical protein R9C00_17370 [Flammeovirgaceae bacterium SG7u.111]|nr:hypothetical protein [Flammeovirgaceae bacterium SG7u.132]WPO33473.1 hypothetical protein R9C00_17370 [Flammeovirgaceae bacterium SG7u.111]